MQCPHCGQTHPENSKFCAVTGQLLTIPNCPVCGKTIQPGVNFCPYCATQLSQGEIAFPPPPRKMQPVIIAATALFLVLILIGSVYFFWKKSQQPSQRDVVQKPILTQSQRIENQSSKIPETTPSPTSNQQIADEPLEPTTTSTPTETPTLIPTNTPTLVPTNTLIPSLTATVPLPFENIGWITYAYGVDNQREIYLLNPLTKEIRQITFNDYTDEAPSFSPDNSQIVYASYRLPDGWELFVYNLVTGVETQVTKFQGQARFPKWSPIFGDDRIIFEGRSGNLSSYNYNLWWIRSNGEDLEVLTSGNSDSRPRWSPDGTKVVFERATRDNTGDGKISTDDNSDMYILDFATGENRAVTQTPGENDVQYDWSPDGEWIAFVSARKDVTGDGHINLSDAQDIYLVHPDGSSQQVLDLSHQHAYTPNWSQDGKKILYLVSVGINRNEIWIYDVQTTEKEKLTEAGPYYHPEWAKQSIISNSTTP